MPYITHAAKAKIDAERKPADCGELNYQISIYLLRMVEAREAGRMVLMPYTEIHEDVMRFCRAYLVANVAPVGRLRYAHGNDIMGVLACARHELLRRITPRRAEVFGNLAKVLAAVESEFYAEVLAPYETTKIQENGDLPYVG
jgi:hypothetical protein